MHSRLAGVLKQGRPGRRSSGAEGRPSKVPSFPSLKEQVRATPGVGPPPRVPGWPPGSGTHRGCHFAFARGLGLSFWEQPPGGQGCRCPATRGELLRKADPLGLRRRLCLQRPAPFIGGGVGAGGPPHPRAPGHRRSEVRSLQATEQRSPLSQPPPRPPHTSPT